MARAGQAARPERRLPAGRPLRVFISAGEASGDFLGAGLIAALRAALGEAGVEFSGVGGPLMEAEGFRSIYPMSDVAVMGLLPVIGRIGRLAARFRQCRNAVLDWAPDVLVIIDFQDFNHLLARAVRKRRPDLPIVNYVPPSIWAWRPGRAVTMRRTVTRSLCLFPFEPEAHARLGAPPCVYVGHPLIERLDDAGMDGPEEAVTDEPGGGDAPLILVLPGSRAGEVHKMMPVFGAAAALIGERVRGCRFVIAVPDTMAAAVRAQAARWPVAAQIVTGEAAKRRQLARARAALAKSGTVTLELALARVPMVVGYRLDWFTARLAWLVKVPAISLPNLIVGRRAVPEFVHKDCTPQALAAALIPLIGDTPERAAQMRAFAEAAELMRLEAGTPSRRAAAEVLDVLGDGLGETAGPAPTSASP